MTSSTKPSLATVTMLLASTVATAQEAGTSTQPTLETITVTAQRREQNMQEAPISVQAISAESLGAGGVVDSQSLQALVPGLVFTNNLTAGIPYIRGVGQNTGSLGVESPVAMYIDGVYLVAPASGLFNFNNLERIEVAKGPQGTLFGRNTTGGVIHIITQQPSQEFDWKARVGYGNYQTFTGDAYVTGAVGSNLSTSVAAYYEKQDEGHIRNIFLNRDIGQTEDYGLQNKWLWDASDNTEVGLNLLYNYKAGSQGTTASVYEGALADDRVTRNAGPYTTSSGIPTVNRDAQALSALTVHHDLSQVRLTSISSYHWLWDSFDFVQNAEPLHTPFLPGVAAVTQYIIGRQRTFTQEFQVQSLPGAAISWTAGLYYLHDNTELDVHDLRENQFIFQGSGSNLIFAKQQTKSYAVYLDGSREILPSTNLTLGIRYSEDEKMLTGQTTSVTAAGGTVTTTPAAPGGTTPPLETPKSWGEISYRAVLDYHFTSDVMSYVSYNRGFKSGLYNITAFFNQPVEPEIVDAYEIGLKTELLDHRLRLNMAAYYYDYKDVQLRQVSSAFPGRFLLLNAADATIQGLDADFTAILGANISINGGFSILDAKYGDFPGGPVAIPNPVSVPLPAGCAPLGAALPPAAALPGGNTTISCDLSDTRMIRAPEFTGNLGVRYSLPFSGGAALTIDATDHYNDGFTWDVDGRLRQKPYHDVRASVTWTASSGRWDVSLWGRNLADEEIHANATAGATTTYMPGMPRTYGVWFSIRP